MNDLMFSEERVKLFTHDMIFLSFRCFRSLKCIYVAIVFSYIVFLFLCNYVIALTRNKLFYLPPQGTQIAISSCQEVIYVTR
jgi:hypothetical protein